MDEARIRAHSAEAASALTVRAGTSSFAHRPWRSRRTP
jgi:hypothetical protein